MREIPAPLEIYRHFKGGLYQVIAVATHTETDEEMVVYQALYGDFKIYCRPLSMFMSKVGGEGSGEYRFTRERGNGEAPGRSFDQTVGNDSVRSPKENAEREMSLFGETEGVRIATSSGEDSDAGSAAEFRTAEPPKGGVMSKTIEEEAAELGMDPRVVAFLDADQASARLRILDSLRGMATNEMIDIMAMAAGFDIEEGDPWDRFAELRECLKTVERFETSRLR